MTTCVLDGSSIGRYPLTDQRCHFRQSTTQESLERIQQSLCLFVCGRVIYEEHFAQVTGGHIARRLDQADNRQIGDIYSTDSPLANMIASGSPTLTTIGIIANRAWAEVYARAGFK